MSETHISPVVFVSYSRTDNALVTRLRADLHTQGISTWMDREGILPGTPDWEDALRNAIRAAHAVLLVASPSARSSRYVKDELRIAEMYQRPVYPFWIAGTRWMDSVPLGWGGTQYIDGREGRYETALHDIFAVLKEHPSVPTKDAEPPSETTRDVEPRNPYKGLRAFTSADTLDFFGRVPLIKELVEALKGVLAKEQQGVQSERLLAVVGASGSGKSSVVMAGLLPCLRDEGLPESREWVYLDPIVPGIHPIESLTLALSEHLPEKSLKTIREDLEDDSARGLLLHATALAKRQGAQCTHVVLVVDQFEELFTLTTSEEERRRFIDLLVTAITESRSPVILILTLRADFCDRPMHYPELYRLIDIHHCSVLPMNLKDLRAVIEQPATLPDVQLTFEGDLVGDLLFEVQGQVGALPLLEFTLDQLFQQRNVHCLTLQAYQQMGGVKGALAKHAESTYAALPSEEHRRVARALFLRLIDPGETEQDTTRRRAALSELSLPDAKQTAIMRETADTFILARLLTTNEVAGITTVEVSHEALIREWTRLSDWLRGGREDIHLQQLISEDVSEWEQHGKPRDRLYRGSQLVDANAWAARNMPSGKEMAFLQAGAAHQKRTRASVAAICLLVVLLVLPAAVLFRQTFFPPNAAIVTTLADNGPRSLRQAIFAAKPGGIITFDASLRGVIKLETNLSIDKNLTIRGPGVGLLSIRGSGDFNVVIVKQGASVIISDLAFSGTQQTTEGMSIIDNHGTLTLTNSMVSDNSTFGGSGGISNDGTLTLTNSIISGNVTQSAYGGGVGNYGGSVTISNSSISGNTAFAGAGIFSNQGNVTLSNSTVSGNRTDSNGDGGGIYNVNGGTLTLDKSTVSGNTADNGWGGGINNGYSDVNNSSAVEFTQGGPVLLSDSTISDNTATHGGGILANAGSQANITFSTIYGNTATREGGGIAIMTYDSHKPSQLEMRNTLVAGNHALTGPDISGMLTSNGYNLIQNVSGTTFASNKQHLTDVSIDPYADMRIDPMLSGKPTQIHALLSGSPAIDRTPLDSCLINGISTDQRGVRRPDGNETACDIGAYEYAN